MLLSLMVYVMTVSLLLGLAAWAFERAVRVFAFPTRWIWAAAMTGSFGYTLVAILRPPTATFTLDPAAATPLDALLIPVIGSITQFADPTAVGFSLDTILGAGWVVLSLAVVAVLLRAQLLLDSDRSTWTQWELDGRRVLVSEDLGPGVVGWIQSAIVMPRWAFRMSPQQRELMLRHEAEHCKAGDTRVVGAALLLLTLIPWNLPLWWQVHRLRLAIEIDCDHRVLHRSTDVKRYARLLVEIGARGTASGLSALAFARPIPSIEQRILVMTDTRSPRYFRTVGLTLLAALLVVASCEVDRPPTSVMDPTIGPVDPPTVPADPPVARVEPPTTPAQPQKIRPEDGPVFTPMTVRPEITNREEVTELLMTEYPAALRDAGIGGRVVVWIFVSEEGVVGDVRVSQTSGQAQFDEAALRVAELIRFTPAWNRTEPVAVWIEVPITFRAQ